jgi:hypothetical protein
LNGRSLSIPWAVEQPRELVGVDPSGLEWNNGFD